jgi:hypothetical protein
MPLDMARRAAIPLPAPRSAAAGGRRSETRREFSPRSRSGTSRRSRASRKEAAAWSRSSWRRRSSPGSRAAELASEARLEAAARRASGRPLIQAEARLRRGSRAVIPPSGGLAEPAAAESRQRGSEDRGDAWASDKAELSGRRSGPGRQRASPGLRRARVQTHNKVVMAAGPNADA